MKFKLHRNSRFKIQSKLKKVQSKLSIQNKVHSKKIKEVHLLSQAQKLSWKDLRKRYQKAENLSKLSKLDKGDAKCKMQAIYSSFPIQGPFRKVQEYHIKILSCTVKRE